MIYGHYIFTTTLIRVTNLSLDIMKMKPEYHQHIVTKNVFLKYFSWKFHITNRINYFYDFIFICSLFSTQKCISKDINLKSKGKYKFVETRSSTYFCIPKYADSASFLLPKIFYIKFNKSSIWSLRSFTKDFALYVYWSIYSLHFVLRTMPSIY